MADGDRFESELRRRGRRGQLCLRSERSCRHNELGHLQWTQLGTQYIGSRHHEGVHLVRRLSASLDR